jgi:hypothetical protein
MQCSDAKTPNRLCFKSCTLWWYGAGVIRPSSQENPNPFVLVLDIGLTIINRTGKEGGYSAFAAGRGFGKLAEGNSTELARLATVLVATVAVDLITLNMSLNY